MGVVSPNMGLREWTTPTDNFSFADLDSNWREIDAHDHSSSNGVQLPTAAFPDSAFTAAKFATRGLLPDGFITTPRASSAFQPAKLANNNLSVVRHKFTLVGRLDNAGVPAGGSYYLKGDFQGATTSNRAAVFPIVAADYAVPNRTTQLTLRAAWATNATAPGVTLTFGIATIASGGAAGTWGAGSPGAMVAQPQVTYVSPAASTINTGSLVAATIPADGTYGAVVNSNLAIVASAVMNFCVQIGIRWV